MVLIVVIGSGVVLRNALIQGVTASRRPMVRHAGNYRWADIAHDACFLAAR
jgi:hypothetical protein